MLLSKLRNDHGDQFRHRALCFYMKVVEMAVRLSEAQLSAALEAVDGTAFGNTHQ